MDAAHGELERNWSSELSHERGIGFRTDTKHALGIYPFQTGLETEEKGLSPAQIPSSETNKQTKTKKRKQRDKQKEREAGGVLWESGTHLIMQGC